MAGIVTHKESNLPRHCPILEIKFKIKNKHRIPSKPYILSAKFRDSGNIFAKNYNARLREMENEE